MTKSKTFLELSKNIEILNENELGQLRGGFAVFSSNDSISIDGEKNTCTIKNKNRGQGCSGCSAVINK